MARQKVFGPGINVPLDRNAKARIATLARALMRATGKGKAYGAVTAKAYAVLQALLWSFHNAASGACFPSYEAIAAAAGCCRATVCTAIKALEDAGILSWCQRLVRVRESGQVRVLRRLQRESPKSEYVFVSERGAPFSAAGFAKMVERAGEAAGLKFKAHPHMLRHACGYALANAGHDTRSLQAYLGHRNIQHTVRYTELSPARFKDFWR